MGPSSSSSSSSSYSASSYSSSSSSSSSSSFQLFFVFFTETEMRNVIQRSKTVSVSGEKNGIPFRNGTVLPISRWYQTQRRGVDSIQTLHSRFNNGREDTTHLEHPQRKTGCFQVRFCQFLGSGG